jgi:hypothetical protein
MKTQCTRQSAFVKQLDELISAYYDYVQDRLSLDQANEYIDIFVEKKNHFVNLWCPIREKHEI